jgi:hypothetical protein
MSTSSRRCSRLEYCQFLLSSQGNYTMTHLAEHTDRFSHDAVQRYLRGDRVTPRAVWEQVRNQVVPSPQGYLLFDDTVLDKNHARKIETLRRQYSGNERRVIRGIGVVTCVYVNAELDQFWILDYRIWSPDEDGKSKLDHVQEMLLNVVHQKRLPFRAVLMDIWYATRPLMRQIEALGKLYYCPVKGNRNADDTEGQQPHRAIETLSWSEAEQRHGKRVHLKDFPRGHRVKLFRLVPSTGRTEFVATNDLTQDSAEATRQTCGLRWRIEQFHREAKQTTGMERCQARTGRIQRNHIGCAILVWVRLKTVARQSQQSIYALKRGLLREYLIHQLRSPSIPMVFA